MPFHAVRPGIQPQSKLPFIGQKAKINSFASPSYTRYRVTFGIFKLT